MNYIRVRSSNIEAVGYEEDSQTLGVRFRDGGGIPLIGCATERL